jgi:hypothetical protein
MKIFLFIFFLFPTIAQAAITVLHDASTSVNIVASNSVSLTITSTTAGNFVAVACVSAEYSGLVNISGVTDSAGDLFTLAPNTISTATANNNATLAIYYTNSISGGQTTVTCNFGQTGSYLGEVWEWEFSGVTNPQFDRGGAVNNSTAVGTTETGPTLLTTGTTEWGVAGISTLNGISTNPKAGNTWTSGGGAGMITSSGDAATGIIATSPGSTAPVWTNNTSGIAYNSSAATWYVSVATSSSVQGNSTIRGNSTVN